jgi:molecular chaperone GrpE (heat shock protein)
MVAKRASSAAAKAASSRKRTCTVDEMMQQKLRETLGGLDEVATDVKRSGEDNLTLRERLTRDLEAAEAKNNEQTVGHGFRH